MLMFHLPCLFTQASYSISQFTVKSQAWTEITKHTAQVVHQSPHPTPHCFLLYTLNTVSEHPWSLSWKAISWGKVCLVWERMSFKFYNKSRYFLQKIKYLRFHKDLPAYIHPCELHNQSQPTQRSKMSFGFIHGMTLIYTRPILSAGVTNFFEVERLVLKRM